MVKIHKNDVFPCFQNLSYASNMLLYGSVTLFGITALVYSLPLLYFVCLHLRYDGLDYVSSIYSYSSLAMIPVYITIILSNINTFASKYPFGEFL